MLKQTKQQWCIDYITLLLEISKWWLKVLSLYGIYNLVISVNKCVFYEVTITIIWELRSIWLKNLKYFWTVNEWQVWRHETQTSQLQLHDQESLIPTHKFNIPNINGTNTLTQDNMGLLPVTTVTQLQLVNVSNDTV